MIYAVQILGGQYVKIGFCAKSVESRITSLQTGNPFLIEKIFTISGTLKQEKHLHYLLFEAFKHGGMESMPPNEWYPGDAKFFIGFLFHLRISIERGFAYLQEHAPKAPDRAERNRKRLERFLKFNTNPDAVFKKKTGPALLVPEWPKSIKKIPARSQEMMLALLDE
jgi:hypothetical protein